MQILTPSGYKDIADVAIGDEVLAFDTVSGERIVNTVESFDYITRQRFFDESVNPRYLANGTIRFGLHSVRLATQRSVRVRDLAIGDVIIKSAIETEEVTSITRLDDEPEFSFVRVNGNFILNADQSIWRNGHNVCKARDLVVGDVIYDEADNAVA